MKYFVRNRGDQISRQLTEAFHKTAQSSGMVLEEQQPQIVVSIGGDGTMLHAIHQYIEQIDSIAFVGVHTGHLGFYADWKSGEIDALIHLMASTELSSTIVKYPMAELDVYTKRNTTTYLACNEFTIKGMDATLVAQLHINDEPFEMFRGDGIVISTPTGSTAYNKSLGGAIIHPALPSVQIAEIASINNRVYRTLGSSMVLPKHHHCDIYPNANQNIQLAVDHHQMNQKDIVSIRIKVSEKKVSFARYRPFPFWNRVRDAFVGKIEK